MFDVGGVLYDWHPRFLFDRMTDDTALVDRLVAEAVTHEWHFQHDAGRDFADTSAELIAQFPHYAHFIEAFGPRFNETNRAPIPGTHEILRELDARGVPLFAITNFSHEFFPPFAAQHAEIFDRFRKVVVSGTEKLMKPHPEIYRRARARFGLAPGEGLFIDDRKDNAEASEPEGFVGYHFTGADSLRTRLEGLGLL
ncbi:MAG: HAD family hydrolase [Sphingomonadaceae bacterium]